MRKLICILSFFAACSGGNGNDCGNETVQPELGEECDDGNQVAGDGCAPNCQFDGCGDGLIDADAGETCDDSGRTNEDGCDDSCNAEFCGDGIVQAGLREQCDDGNFDAGDGCGSTCRSEACGDGVVGAGEQCDDGNILSFDGCQENCTSGPVCGNGSPDTGEVCYDTEQLFFLSSGGVTAVASADLDGDGDLDLAAVSGFSLRSIDVFENQGDGSFLLSETVQLSSDCFASFLSLTDINGDSFLDALSGCESSGDVSLVLGEPGGFGAEERFVVAGGADLFVLLDIEGDNDLDLGAARRDRDEVKLFLNDGGRFLIGPDIPLGVGVTDLASGDLDADGDFDLVVSARAGFEVSLLSFENADGQMIPSALPSLLGINEEITLADINGDSFLDLSTTTAFPTGFFGRYQFYLGDGQGSFGAPETRVIGFEPQRVLIGDIDGNGNNDVSLVVSDDLGIDLFDNALTTFFAENETVSLQRSVVPFTNSSLLLLVDLNGDGRADQIGGDGNTSPSALYVSLSRL